MSQPVKLADALVLDARLTGQAARRSIAGQIEFWANVGRAIEPLLQGRVANALCRTSAARSLSECLDTADSPEGRERLRRHLAVRPYPHYEPADKPGLLVRTGADGSRTVGRFVGRRFVPEKPARTRRHAASV